MNFFQLALKQMRQRALSTWLTLLSVILAVALAIAVLVIQREGDHLLAQADFGYDLLVGPRGSETQLVFSTVYHIGKAQTTIPYAYFERFPDNLPEQHRFTPQWKVPIAFGDNYKGYRIVGTSTTMFGVGEDGQPLPASQTFQYRQNRSFELAQGRVFHPRKFEAIVGSEAADLAGLKLGDTFQATHGDGASAHADEHTETWTVVGILKPTRTANDRIIYIPLVSFYAIPGHDLEALAEVAGHDPHDHPAPPASQPASQPAPPPAHDDHDHHDHPPGQCPATQQAHDHDHDEHDHPEVPAATRPTTSAAAHDDHDHPQPHAATRPAAHKATPPAACDHNDHHHTYHLLPDGTIDLLIPTSQWRINAMMVRTHGGNAASAMAYAINNGTSAMAVIPGDHMRQFTEDFLRPATTVLLIIAVLVTVVAAVSILVSIYNSVSARRKEIAVLRALGATRRRVLALICFEAASVGLVGGIAGLLLAHAAAGAGAYLVRDLIGEAFNWLAVSPVELLYLLGVTLLAALAGLVPALKAYKTSVATHLVAG